MYNVALTNMRIIGGHTSGFPIYTKAQQLRPYLFVLVIDEITCHIQDEVFVNDVVLIVETRKWLSLR